MSREPGPERPARRRWWSALALLCLLPALAEAQPARVETGRLEARAERNFGRLVFSFAQRPPHQVRAQSGVLVIQFERPVDVDLAATRDALRPYVAEVRRDADGRGLRFALTRRLRVNTSEAADQLYVDLLPEPWSGAPPPLPAEVLAELARRAEEAERQRQEEAARQRRRALIGPVEVIASETPTFSRLEFRWRERAQAQLQRTDREVRLVFDRLGDIAAGPLRARLPRFVEEARVTEEDNRTVVTLAIDPLRDVRSFVEGTSFNLDVIGPERGRAVELRADGAVGGAEPRAGAAEATTRQAAVPPSPVPTAQAAAAPRPAPASAEPRAETGANEGRPEIRFFFPRETAAAVFTRGRTLWIVLDGAREIDVAALRAELPRLVRSGERERVEGVEVVRLQLREDMAVSARSEGQRLVVMLGDAPAEARRSVELASRRHADGRLFLVAETPAAARTVRLADPLVGDTLDVVLVGPDGAVAAKPQGFVEVELLRSALGLALRPALDDVTVTLRERAVVIERPTGLTLSAQGARAAAAAPAAGAAQAQREGFIDFEGWKLGPVDRFGAIRNELVRRAGESEGAARGQARLDLARFYLAHQLAAEAVGLLQLVVRDDPAAEREASFRALRGAATTLAGRHAEAERDLAEPGFVDRPDVALWRGLAAAERRDWPAARRLLVQAQPVLGGYPRLLQAQALSTLALAAVELGDVGRLDQLVEEVAALDVRPSSRARLALLRARAAEAQRRVDAALDLYLEAQTGPAPDIAAEAGVRRVALATAEERMTPAAGAAALAPVQLGWRGDGIELEALRLGARLDLARGAHREAFAAMRAAAEAEPASAITRGLQDEMSEAFAALFLEGGLDRRPPAEALALFYDYRDLVPSGRRGDELIRNLADRLVALDLLDQAADLLTHQVDNRLEGSARAEVAAQLAIVQLMNRRPEQALAVLRRTRGGAVSAELDRRRLLIEARALAGVGRPELAVELLGEDASEPTQRLKADLLWEGARWREAAALLEALVGDGARGALPDRGRADVMRAAVAYALAADQPGLDRLRLRFAAPMAASPDAEAFRVVTAAVERQGAEFRAIARSIAATDTADAFLRRLREGRAPAPQASGRAAGRAG